MTVSWTDTFQITHFYGTQTHAHLSFLWLCVVEFQSWAWQWITDGWMGLLSLLGARSEEYTMKSPAMNFEMWSRRIQRKGDNRVSINCLRKNNMYLPFFFLITECLWNVLKQNSARNKSIKRCQSKQSRTQTLKKEMWAEVLVINRFPLWMWKEKENEDGKNKQWEEL